MKLQLKIDGEKLNYKLLTPNGEEIEGIEDIKISTEDFPLVTVKLLICSGTLDLG